MPTFHLDDVIVVQDIDADGRRYAEVSEIDANNEDGDICIKLDVLNKLYRMKLKQKYRMVLSETLDTEGSPATSNSSKGKKETLADKFEFVMYGVVYKMSEEGSKVIVTLSFGGFQLVITGPPTKLCRLKLHERLYLLLKKE